MNLPDSICNTTITQLYSQIDAEVGENRFARVVSAIQLLDDICGSIRYCIDNSLERIDCDLDNEDDLDEMSEHAHDYAKTHLHQGEFLGNSDGVGHNIEQVYPDGSVRLDDGTLLEKVELAKALLANLHAEVEEMI